MITSPAAAATFAYVSNALPTGFSGKPWAADLHITPNGKFLYGTERTSRTITGFAVDGASGKLTPIGSVETEKQPRGFVIGLKGRYLLAVGQQSHAMSVYSIDPSKGTPSRVKQLPVGRNPQWAEIVELPQRRVYPSPAPSPFLARAARRFAKRKRLSTPTLRAPE